MYKRPRICACTSAMRFQSLGTPFCCRLRRPCVSYSARAVVWFVVEYIYFSSETLAESVSSQAHNVAALRGLAIQWRRLIHCAT